MLLLALGLFVACRQGPAPAAGPTPLAEPVPPTPAATAGPTDAPTHAAAANLAATPTATARASLPAAAPATPTALPLVGDPCGVILPLVAGTAPAPAPALDPDQALDDVPEAAREAVRYLLANPADVALVAYRLGQEESGISLNADAPMPLASVAKLINLVAYVRAVEAGELDPTEWVPLDELDRYYLPNSDLSAHRYALEDAAARDLIADDETPLEEIPWMMTRHSSNAAADYLAARLGQSALEATALALGLGSQTAPCSFLGQFLAMGNHTRTTSDADALEAYLAEPASYGADVSRLATAYAADAAFRAEETAWRRAERRPNARTQAAYSAALGVSATAAEYARLMATIAANELGSAYQNILVRRYLEWPMLFAVNQERFWTMGYKGGSLPGILTGVYYGEPLAYRVPVVVAIFFRDLPMSTYRQWRRDWPHDELAIWLMADPEAIPTLRRLLP